MVQYNTTHELKTKQKDERKKEHHVTQIRRNFGEKGRLTTHSPHGHTFSLSSRSIVNRKQKKTLSSRKKSQKQHVLFVDGGLMMFIVKASIFSIGTTF